MTAKEIVQLPTDPWRAVFDRAQGRSARSTSRAKYMYAFEDTLKFLRRYGEQALIERRSAWKDATEQAAEIEALSAYRAMQHWGTDWGLCPPSDIDHKYAYQKFRRYRQVS